MKFPSIDDVALALRNENNDCEADTDVRLQVLPDGCWWVHTGDASYDTDHRGHWGSDALPGRLVGYAEVKWARDMARHLLDQVRDSAVQDTE